MFSLFIKCQVIYHAITWWRRVMKSASTLRALERVIRCCSVVSASTPRRKTFRIRITVKWNKTKLLFALYGSIFPSSVILLSVVCSKLWRTVDRGRDYSVPNFKILPCVLILSARKGAQKSMIFQSRKLCFEKRQHLEHFIQVHMCSSVKVE